jgi:DNA-directed RNA polymerase
MKATGGYVIHQTPLIRRGIHAHTSALERPVSEFDLDSLNAVQATGWRINRWLLDVMLDAWVNRRGIAGLVEAELKPMPDKVDDAVWEAMAPADQTAHRRLRMELHGHNASAEGRQEALMSTLAVANDLRDQPTIWFPHSRCFRGRIHPLPQVGPQPQGSDGQKALIMFAAGLPLGPDGLFWLCVRAANCAGQDKLALEDRVGWVLERRELIVATAAEPFANLWWCESSVDEPWGLLATVNELAMAFTMENPDDFVSHLPIPLDGSCNGLQHLAAIGLDPVGARATNLCRDTERQDIYLEVARVVQRIVEEDAAAGKEEALAWHGKIVRKTVKRAVMTTPYGVTDSGIRTQLLSEGLVPDAEVGKGKAADYLRDCLVRALGETVQSARSVMAWLQTVADRLARAGLAFEWTTPTGSRVRQAYHACTSRRVSTLCGELRLEEETAGAPLIPRKQALGAAPNYIHSLDGSHLSATVRACHLAGIRSFAMIHDSFGTHARNTTELNAVLRAEFVSIYKTDWLKALAEEIAAAHPHVELPPLPPRGDFDISQIEDAPFFFS